MSVPAYLRYPALLLAAVAAVIAFVWYLLGRPAEMPRAAAAADGRFDCIAYAPAPPGRSVAAARIEEDLARLPPHARCVRVDLAAGLDPLPQIAARHGLSVLLGVALGGDGERNRAAIERAITFSHEHGPAIGAIVVGGRVLSRGVLDLRALRPALVRLREATNVPLSYADLTGAWLAEDALASLVDFVTLEIEPYAGAAPVAASEVAAQAAAARERIAAAFPGKDVLVSVGGWPDAGRMRGAARPSPANQARAFHELRAAAASGAFRLGLHEAYDEEWRSREAGVAGAHMGFLSRETGDAKFRWGAPVLNHPLWPAQAATGILLAFIVFASAFLAARSEGPDAPAAVPWHPVAAMALAGGLLPGWAVAELPLQGSNLAGWAQSALLVALAFATPPVAAAALVRRVPFESVAAVLNAPRRRALPVLAQAATLLFALAVFAAVPPALGLVFDPDARDIPFAALTGPAVSLLLLSLLVPRGPRYESLAEPAAVLVLAAAALFIAVNEGVWNWQAQWFAATLLALAWTCWRAPGAQRRPA